MKDVPGPSNNIKSILSSEFRFVVTIFLLISSISLSLFISSPTNAETGVGKDVFKIIVSIFGITKETGDVVATATVNGNSKVKSFDVDALTLNPAVDSSAGQIIEYLATFPGEEVKPGDAYKVCVMILETSESICHDGSNSLGKRPEVVDISLDKAATSSSSEEVDSEEVDSEEVDSEEVDSEEVDSEEVDSEEVDSEA
jgi:hypothetical protein